MREWEDPEVLAQRYAQMVYRMAYARTGSKADAEDVVQEVFLRLVRARPSFRDEEHGKAWLLRVAANCTNDLFRLPWRKREEPLQPSMAAEEGPEPSGVLEAVLALPEKYRLVVHLYYYEELSTAEIGRIMRGSGQEQAVPRQKHAPQFAGRGGVSCLKINTGGRWIRSFGPGSRNSG